LKKLPIDSIFHFQHNRITFRLFDADGDVTLESFLEFFGFLIREHIKLPIHGYNFNIGLEPVHRPHHFYRSYSSFVVDVFDDHADVFVQVVIGTDESVDLGQFAFSLGQVHAGLFDDELGGVVLDF